MELERVNARLARGVAEQRMMQMRVDQLRAEAEAHEEGCCQVGQTPAFTGTCARQPRLP